MLCEWLGDCPRGGATGPWPAVAIDYWSRTALFWKGKARYPGAIRGRFSRRQPAASQAGKVVIKSQEGSIKAVLTNASITRERPLGQPANLQLATSNDAVLGTGAHSDSHGSGSLSALVVGSHLNPILAFEE